MTFSIDRIRLRTRAGRVRATAPLAWIRAVAFGVISGGFGVVGHDVTSGDRTSTLLVIAAIAFATLVARPLAPLRIGPRTMVAGLVTLQLVIHLACIAQSPAPPQTAAMHAAHVQHSFGQHASAMATMVAIHALMTVIGAIVLLALEARAWRLVREVVRALVGHRYRTASTRGASFRRPFVATRTDHRHLWVVGTGLVRGPPPAATAHA